MLRASLVTIALVQGTEIVGDDEATLLQTRVGIHEFQAPTIPNPADATQDPFTDLCEPFTEVGKADLTAEEKAGWGATDKHKQFGAGKGSYTSKKMHGPWGNDFKELERTWKLNPSTTKCTLKWTQYGQHSRDNEYDRVFVNGVKIWEQRMSGNKEYIKDWTGDCSGELKVKWTSDIDQAVNDEAWGFNDVQVLQNDCVPTTTTTINPLSACQPGRSCGTLKVLCQDGIEWNVEASQVEKNGELKVDCSDGGAWVIRAAPSFTTTTTLCNGVLYDERGDGAIGEGWSNTDVGAGTNEHTDIAKMHGPWGNELKEVTRTWDVLGGNKCTVSWTSYGMHSRDSEWDRLFINGDKVWEKQMRGGTEENPSWTGDCDKNGDGKLTLKYTSAIDEHKNNEKWGFNNVKIEQTGCDGA